MTEEEEKALEAAISLIEYLDASKHSHYCLRDDLADFVNELTDEDDD